MDRPEAIDWLKRIVGNGLDVPDALAQDVIDSVGKLTDEEKQEVRGIKLAGEQARSGAIERRDDTLTRLTALFEGPGRP